MDFRSSPIAAIATAPGRGGIGVVRISGKDLAPVMEAVCGTAQLQARHATYLDFIGADGSVIDRGLAIYFRAPHSYTGEDVLELQGHGGPVVLQMLLARCIEAGREIGLRLAQPGEFTQRAFLNDKLDLAHAMADLGADRDDLWRMVRRRDACARARLAAHRSLAGRARHVVHVLAT